MLTEEQREFLLPKAYNAALRAGAAILDIYLHETDYGIDIKSDKTPITQADRISHQLIKEYLGQTRIPLLSEEGREMLYEERRGWDLFWIVDPLDGTKEFIKGNGEFTVNIALMADNKPVISVVYVPYISKMYFCDKAVGAFVKEATANRSADLSLEQIYENARRLPLVNKANQPIRIAISRSHNTAETFNFIDILKRRFPDAEVIQQGSSYKFCLLAEGRIDCYVRTTNTYEWDTAAGELILAESGGSTRSLPGHEPFEYNKISLLNPYFICKSKFMPKYDPEK